MSIVPVVRRARGLQRRFRQARLMARAFKYPNQPVVAHLIPTRRCNLACTYCNEFDDHSAPVTAADVLRRVDLLAALGTGIVTLSGGEPLLHPALDEIVSRIRRHRMIATLITNGYLLSGERIRRLNHAGLDHLQISIDNVMPDEVSKKSLKVLDQKLRHLAQHAEFDVTINVVVGSGLDHPDDALVIARRAAALGFSTTAGIMHDHKGQMRPLDEGQRRILEAVAGMGSSLLDYANYNRFQKNLSEGRPTAWQCRAGSRYLYVCEDGLVHWCSQQRGYPGIPLERYGREHLEREYSTVKPCAPFCTVGCVHRVAQLDELREQPLETLVDWFPATSDNAARKMPIPIRALSWIFITNRHHDFFRDAVQRVFGMK